MTGQIVNYQCPACTGPLHFNGSSGMLECDYCFSKFTVEEIAKHYESQNTKAAEAFSEQKETDWDLSELSSQWENADQMKAYICPSCSAELICDEHTAATKCPYCGNPTVVPGQFKDSLKPDYILPFKYSQDDAIEALKKYYRGKKFLPKEFSEQNHIEEIQGVYVPFWMFDGKVHANITFDATKSHSLKQGQFLITNTDHFDVHRVGTVSFEKIPVDCSKRMPDGHMDAIEPFDYSMLKEFSTAYLPGFLAERTSLSVKECVDRADARVQNSTVQMIKEDVIGYESITEKQRNLQIERGKIHYALLPVYLLATKYQNQDYLFAMNGQTGKLIGNLPVDKTKYWTTFLSIFVGVTLAAGTLLWLML